MLETNIILNANCNLKFFKLKIKRNDEPGMRSLAEKVHFEGGGEMTDKNKEDPQKRAGVQAKMMALVMMKNHAG